MAKDAFDFLLPAAVVAAPFAIGALAPAAAAGAAAAAPTAALGGGSIGAALGAAAPTAAGIGTGMGALSGVTAPQFLASGAANAGNAVAGLASAPGYMGATTGFGSNPFLNFLANNNMSGVANFLRGNNLAGGLGGLTDVAPQLAAGALQNNLSEQEQAQLEQQLAAQQIVQGMPNMRGMSQPAASMSALSPYQFNTGMYSAQPYGNFI